MFVSKSPESIRMFKNPLIEALSKVHFAVPLIVFVPIIGYIFYRAYQSPVVGLLELIMYGLLGFLVWTIVEYVMHRYIFHFHPSSEFGKKLHFIFHGVHHDYPQDRLRLVLPPAMSIPLATGFFFLFRSFITTDVFYPFFGAFLIGYLCYDMLHYAIHHLKYEGRIWQLLKTHHLKHHYMDDEKGYGVSSPLWDIIIRSNFDNKKLGSN